MKKLNPQFVAKIIEWAVGKSENLGDQIGGSGHLARRTLCSISVDEQVETDEGLTVLFSFAIQTETEFTIYPDNPPIEELKNGSLLIDAALIQKFESESKVIKRQREIDDRRFLDSVSGF